MTAYAGIAPAAAAYRCIPMQVPVEPGHGCPMCDAPPLSIGAPCCEKVYDARSVDTSSEVRRLDTQLASAPLLAIGSLPYLPAFSVETPQVITWRSHPPPGDLLHQLSQVQRV
jgi:hypothetical protein